MHSSPTEPPEDTITRYLFIGRVTPHYQGNGLALLKYYKGINLKQKIECIEELALNLNDNLLIIDVILKALKNKEYVSDIETLIFALAICIRQTVNVKLRAAAYNIVPFVCSEPQHFILLIELCNQLNKLKLDPTNGYGHGWRNCVKKWYNSKSPLELAKCVTQCKGRYGWKHKDIIKLAHYHSDSPAVNFIIQYIMNGFAKAKEKVTCTEEIEEVVTYIENIERFKHCEDELQAARFVEMYNLVLDHVPGHFLKSEEVWISLVQTMNLNTLIETLYRIHNLGFLKSGTPICTRIIELLSCKDKILEDNVQPALVYITIRQYECSEEPWPCVELKAKFRSSANSAINPEVLSCLYKTLELSSENLKPSSIRYFFTINFDELEMSSFVWRNNNLKVMDALLILIYSLRCENNLSLITFNGSDVHTENITKSQTFADLKDKMINFPVAYHCYSKPLYWASDQNKIVDVFIIAAKVNDDEYRMHSIKTGFDAYRKKMNLPNTKLVILDSMWRFDSPFIDKNILCIFGFDEKVPKIIEGFAKSLF